MKTLKDVKVGQRCVVAKLHGEGEDENDDRLHWGARPSDHVAERLSHAPRAVAVVLPEVCPEVFRAGEGGASDEAVPGVGRATVVAADLHGADDRSDEALSRRETLQAEAWRRNEYLGHQLVERSVRQWR